MKKIFLICFILLIGFTSFGQAIINRAGPANTVLDQNLFVGNSFRIPVFADTLSANAVTSLDSCGKMIYTRDAASLWFRACTGASNRVWIQVLPTGGSPTTDTTYWKLTGNYQGSNIPFLGLIDNYQLRLGANNTVHMTIPAAGISRTSDAVYKYLVIDTTGEHPLAYSDGGGGGGSGTVTSIATNDGTGITGGTITTTGTLVIDTVNTIATKWRALQNVIDSSFSVTNAVATSVGLAVPVTSTLLTIKGLVAGTGITLSDNSDTTVTISSSGASTASNGLYLDGTTVKLGTNPLTENTTIDGNSNAYSLNIAALHSFSVDGDDDMVISTTGGGSYINSIYAATGGVGMSSSYLGRGSDIIITGDTTRIRPSLGNLTIDTLTSAVGTKALRYNPTTGLVSYADTTTGGGIDTTNQFVTSIYDNQRNDLNSIFYTKGSSNPEIRLKNADQFYSEASSYIFNGDVAIKSSAVDTAHWWDGTGAVSLGKRLYSFGGWYDTTTTGTVYTGRVRYSEDNGATWTPAPNPDTLPFAAHSFVYFKSRGYLYILGSDNAHTSLSETVWRTRDMVTFEVMTTTAGWGVRQTMGGFADEYGNLYMSGGQTTSDVATGHNDVWKSTDYGATWTQIVDSVSVGGTYFLGQNISNALKYFNGRVYVVGGGILAGSPTYLATVYSVSIDSIDVRTAWRAEQSMPSASQYISVEVWDGKLWAWGGYNTSPGNKNTMYYLDKAGVWHTFLYNYTGNVAANTITATHAAAITVHNDKLYQILGNGMNQCVELSRSSYAPFITFRDSVLANTVLATSSAVSKTSLFVTGGSSKASHANSGQITIGGLAANQGHIYYSGSTGVLTLENTFNSAGNAFIFKTRTTGTPVNALIINGNGAVLPYSLQIGTSTVTGSINWQNASSSTGYMQYTGTGQFDYWTNNVHRLSMTDAAFLPNTSGGITLGTGTKPFGNIFTSGSIALGVSAANASAAIDITSTTKGLLLPRMTSTQASAITGVNGLLLYVTDTNGTFTAVGVWAYVAGAWTQL